MSHAVIGHARSRAPWCERLSGAVREEPETPRWSWLCRTLTPIQPEQGRDMLAENENGTAPKQFLALEKTTTKSYLTPYCATSSPGLHLLSPIPLHAAVGAGITGPGAGCWLLFPPDCSHAWSSPQKRAQGLRLHSFSPRKGFSRGAVCCVPPLSLEPSSCLRF